MDINYFLSEHIQLDKSFVAIVISIDIAGHSKFSGTNKQSEKTKAAIKNHLNSLIGDKPMAIMNWSGDGGLILCDAGHGGDEVIQFCDQVISLISWINRSRNIVNYLKNDDIHFRIVCNSGLIENTGDPTTLSSPVINNLCKEREVGIIDHVVLTKDVRSLLHQPLKKRCTLLPVTGTKLDPVYVLDKNYSCLDMELNEGKSEKIRDWIADMALQGNYDELLIFSYTNETLYQYMTSRLPNLDVKVLMRNWLVEQVEEEKFNIKEGLHKKARSKKAVLRRPWSKSHTIRAVAEQLHDQDKRPSSPSVDVRFYTDKPLLKGAILRGNNTLAANIGFYSWNPLRKDGGSPYLGENWPSIWIKTDGTSKDMLLESLVSRFEELWENSPDFDEMMILEDKLAHSLQYGIENVFSYDGRPYMILYPGRFVEDRTLPLVACEDMTATYLLKELLERKGAKVVTEVITDDDYQDNIQKWDGHIIALCHRSYKEGQLSEVSLSDSPFRIDHDTNPATLWLDDLSTSTFSPMDQDPSKDIDHCVIQKISRSNDRKFFFIAGLHAIGTWGGGIFLTTEDSLIDLASRVEENDFSVIIECSFSIPQREITAKILHGPSTPAFD